MLGAALLLSCVRSVEVLVAMATADGREKFLSHNLTLVSQRSKGGGTLWNMDKRGTLYRFRTARHYVYVNGKGRLAMRDGGAKFKKIAEDERIRRMQSIIGDDASASSSDSSSTQEGSSDGSGDDESRSSDGGARGRRAQDGDRRRVAQDRAKRRKMLGRDGSQGKDKGREAGSGRGGASTGGRSKRDGDSDEDSDERGGKSGGGKSDGGKSGGGRKGKKLPSEPIVDKGGMLLSSVTGAARLKSRLLNGDEEEQEPHRAEGEEASRDSGDGDGGNAVEAADKAGGAADASPAVSKHSSGLASALLLDEDSPFFVPGADAEKAEKKEEQPSGDGPEEQSGADGLKAGAKKFLSNLVGAVTSAGGHADSKASALVEKKRVTAGPGFYFELIPVFKNKVDRGTLIVYRDECYTHNLRFEKCSYDSYWDLDPKYFWSIFPTSDNRYLGVLRSYIEKSEEKMRRLEALDCIRIDKCPPRIVCKPTVENSCPPQGAPKPGQCARGGARTPSASLLSCTQGQGPASPLQRPVFPRPQAATRPSEMQRGMPTAGAGQGAAQQPCPPSACAQQPCPSGGRLSVRIADGYKLEDSLGDKLLAAYKG